MNTPIYDFVKKYAKSKNVRLHMPGHKGKPFLGFEQIDITEIKGADELYRANSIIKESQKNASLIFDSQATFYSTEGTSLSIRACVYLASLYSTTVKKKNLILSSPCVHKSFISAIALTDTDVEFLPGDSYGFKTDLTALDKALQKTKAVAFFLTSPTYLGYMSEIEQIADVCHKNEALLIVDNAHGAYLKFMDDAKHPLEQNADMVCDSAHKTLPVLTGGAYLHFGKRAPKFLVENAQFALSLFASTSPSYLTLASLDYANKTLCNGYFERQNKIAIKVTQLKRRLIENGYLLYGNEPLKITIATKPYGYIGTSFADILHENKVVAEFYDKDFIVFMISAQTTPKELQKLEKVLLAIPRKEKITDFPPPPYQRKRITSIKKAILSPSEKVKTENSLGRVLSYADLSCPPAIPIAISGELIDENTISALTYYGITEINVIK